MAVLSKELATICIDSPIEYDWEGAKIHNLYTPEAYEFFKELEFKNFLSRFEDTGEENKIEESFRYITDFTETEKIFERALEEPVVGIELLEEKGQILGLGLAWGEEETEVYSILPQGFVTEDYLIEKTQEFCQQGKLIASLNIKAMLRYMDLKSHNDMFDAGLAAYLLNPLNPSILTMILQKNF